VILPMELELWQWGFVMVAAISIGLSKSGFSGVSLIAVFILTEIFGPVAQVGVALPMLLVADCIVMPTFLKHGNWREALLMLPPTLVGGALAVGILHWVENDGLMRQAIGGLILFMVALQLFRRWRPELVYQIAIKKVCRIFAGVSVGLATVLANSAGPIQQMYMASRKIEKMELVGIGARFFLVVNLIKLPVFGQMEIVNAHTLILNAIAIPAIVLGVFAGRKLLTKVSQKVFENLIVIFALVASIRLIFW
jgi:uncharacterized protein